MGKQKCPRAAVLYSEQENTVLQHSAATLSGSKDCEGERRKVVEETKSSRNETQWVLTDVTYRGEGE